MTVAKARPWWVDAVTYQVYVRSFADGDGDGVGDLVGLVQRLDHIAALGVDALWLSPCFPSPWADGGYDVADYRRVDPLYGGDVALDRLVAAAHLRGLRVILDLVPNHCSAEHPWFIAAVASPPGSAERARFHFRDGRGDEGNEPPNNWRSEFGGSAWTRVVEADGVPGQWYLHSFDSSQPDFDWDNEDVREMFDDVLRHWFVRGVDGFRIDVAYALVKRSGLPDLSDPDQPNPYAVNQPGLFPVFERWRSVAESVAVDPALTGEVWLSAEESRPYVTHSRLTQVFAFDLLAQPWEADAFRRSLGKSLDVASETGGGLAWVLSNHDVHRAVSRYGVTRVDGPAHAAVRRLRPRGPVDVALGLSRARAALLILLALPGAAFLYQGEELGLPEVLDVPDDARRDPIWHRSGGSEAGRDGCRVPLPWSATEPGFGFGPPDAPEPWLPQPEFFAALAVESQLGQANSTLLYYRLALALRRELVAREDVDVRSSVDGDGSVLVVERGPWRCAVNFGGEDLALPEEWGSVVIRSDGGTGRVLPANAAAWTVEVRPT